MAAPVGCNGLVRLPREFGPHTNLALLEGRRIGDGGLDPQQPPHLNE
jgi:hypothetical protein